MKSFDADGWTILFYTDFQLQWEELRGKVIKLKARLDPRDFVTHPDVKLLKAIDVGIREKIAKDPFASHFMLRKPLNKYGRLKKMGLPQRYRLFSELLLTQKSLLFYGLDFRVKKEIVVTVIRFFRGWLLVVNYQILTKRW